MRAGATLLLAGWAGLAPAAVDPSKLPPPATRTVDFAKDIQPILENNCWSCHGPKKQESSLRLDEKATALQGGESFGTNVIIPGRGAESVLIQAVAHAHPDLKMPKKGDRLTAGQVGLLRAWIDQGVSWPATAVASGKKDPKEHWAFKTPVRPKVVPARDKKWVRTPIDNFILAKLDAEGLKPSPEADRVTLLRRLHLDLVGLPPTVQEVDAFLNDASKDAYEKAAEKLLASPHHGERWARHWLDAARYADSDGYEKDMSREVWPYRDYVINAFNRDLPYDQFLIEQIAGDELPNATQDQRVATGFLRNSMVNMEGAIDPEQFRMEGMFDRMDALGKAMLGLTIQCAQCHTHKFDPLTQEEYYRMFAFLNSDHEARPVVYTAGGDAEFAAVLFDPRNGSIFHQRRPMLACESLVRRVAARRHRDSALRLIDAVDVVRECELRPPFHDLAGVEMLIGHIARGERVHVCLRRNRARTRCEIDASGNEHQGFAILLCYHVPTVVGAFRQLHVARRVIGEPNDPRMILRFAAPVSHLELFDAEDVFSDPAREPVGRRTAESAEPEDDVIVLATSHFVIASPSRSRT